MCKFVVTTIIMGAGLLGLHVGTVCPERKRVAHLQREKGTGMIADRDFSDRYWELQVCGEVENLELQIISEGNVPGIGGSSV